MLSHNIHIIFSQKCHITISIYVVHIKTCHMKQHTISHSWFSNRNIPHYSTWQFSVETLQNANYDTNTIYYSMKYNSHLQIHMFIDT